jgi:2-polyprenyl-6-methoxyphenol hydroxylase-like FAD-dependent oxidoreductase
VSASGIDCDVLVVGAGPVGLTMTWELMRQGMTCRVIDLAAQASDKSKALVVWGRTLELLGVGSPLVGELQSRGVLARAANIHGNGRRLLRIEFDQQDTAFPRPLMIPQCDTEGVLTEFVKRGGVEVERATKLLDFVDEGTRVKATLRGPKGQPETVVCSWIIGCDGAHSTVRKRLGVEFAGEFEPNDWILADLRLDGPMAADELNIFWHSRGIAAFFPIGRDRFRVIADMGLAPGVEKPPDPTLEQVQQAIDARGLKDVRLRDPVWLAGFRIHERIAARYSQGRAFLAGDAAHIHSPAGGQGMNTGMQDACNLAWKLALVHRGRAPIAPLLDSYRLERRAVGEMVLRNASRLTQLATLRNPILQFLRNHAAALAGNLTAVQQRAMAELNELTVHYPHSPLNGDDSGPTWSGLVKPGDRLPDAELRDLRSGHVVRLLAIGQSTRHRLLILQDAQGAVPWDSLLASWTALSAEFHELLDVCWIVCGVSALDEEAQVHAQRDPDGSWLADVDDRLRERLGVRGAAMGLVRPDGYLAFCGGADSWARLRAHLSSYLTTGRT